MLHFRLLAVSPDSACSTLQHSSRTCFLPLLCAFLIKLGLPIFRCCILDSAATLYATALGAVAAGGSSSGENNRAGQDRRCHSICCSKSSVMQLPQQLLLPRLQLQQTQQDVAKQQRLKRSVSRQFVWIHVQSPTTHVVSNSSGSKRRLAAQFPLHICGGFCLNAFIQQTTKRYRESLQQRRSSKKLWLLFCKGSCCGGSSRDHSQVPLHRLPLPPIWLPETQIDRLEEHLGVYHE